MSVGKRKRRSGGKILVVVLMVLILAALAIVVAAWISFSQSGGARSSYTVDSSQQNSLASNSEQVSSMESSQNSGSSKAASSPQSSSSQGDSSGQSSGEAVDPLAKQTRVKDTYFADSVFIGDSLTDGLSLYGFLADATVFAYTGLNPNTIRTNEVIKTADGGKVTVLTALKALDPAKAKKIYIMLGSNGIAWLSQKQYIESYSEFLDNVRAVVPDAVIYVQSILPVTEEKLSAANKGKITNQKVQEYNYALRQMIAEKQDPNLYFLNVWEAFANEEGEMPTEISVQDGVHLKQDGYKAWYSYLTFHAVCDDPDQLFSQIVN